MNPFHTAKEANSADATEWENVSSYSSGSLILQYMHNVKFRLPQNNRPHQEMVHWNELTLLKSTNGWNIYKKNLTWEKWKLKCTFHLTPKKVYHRIKSQMLTRLQEKRNSISEENVNYYNPWKSVLRFHKKLKLGIAFCAAPLLWGILPQKVKYLQCQLHTCAIAALSQQLSHWGSRCHQFRERIMKVCWFIHNGDPLSYERNIWVICRKREAA